MIQVTLNDNGDYWQAYWADAGGKRHRVSLGSKSTLTKREARAKCSEMEAQFRGSIGFAGVAQHATLASWREKYHGVSGHGEGTKRLSDQTFVALVEQFGEGRELRTISRLDAADWAGGLTTRKSRRGRGGGKISDNTAGRYVRSARAIFQSAYLHDLIPFNPFDRVKSPESTEAEWEYVPVARVVEVASAIPSPEKRKVLYLSRLAGLRRAEIMALAPSDVDLVGRRITIRLRGKQETTKQRYREVPITDELLAVLSEMPTRSSDKYVNLTTHVVQNWLARERCPWPGKPLHTLRKSCQTDWLRVADPISVCKIMGNSPEVAWKHYDQVLPSVLSAIRSPLNLPQRGDGPGLRAM